MGASRIVPIFLLVTCLFSGCLSTRTTAFTQRVKINSQPEGAKIRIHDAQGSRFLGNAPLETDLYYKQEVYSFNSLNWLWMLLPVVMMAAGGGVMVGQDGDDGQTNMYSLVGTGAASMLGMGIAFGLYEYWDGDPVDPNKNERPRTQVRVTGEQQGFRAEEAHLLIPLEDPNFNLVLEPGEELPPDAPVRARHASPRVVAGGGAKVELAGKDVYIAPFTGDVGQRGAIVLAQAVQDIVVGAGRAKATTKDDLENLLAREEYKEMIDCGNESCVREIVENYGIAHSVFGMVTRVTDDACIVAVKLFDRSTPVWANSVESDCRILALRKTVQEVISGMLE
jgi:hypothetical protein